MTFSSLGLCEPLVRAVADLGYDASTPVQRHSVLPTLTRWRTVGICSSMGGKWRSAG